MSAATHPGGRPETPPVPNFWDRPCAARGFDSYRLRGPYGWIMIGARSTEEAMREAARSTRWPLRENLQRWNGQEYVTV
jgi:hypothetical protein